ncbi:MAG: hypothetical protein FWG87_10210 [Defluviitaleaceae bacterium]|nr:hypothetical protein [Defluviitaleaceae bacterium]
MHYPCKLKVVEHGFNGFTRILSGTFFYPRNPCKSVKSVKSAFNRF